MVTSRNVKAGPSTTRASRSAQTQEPASQGETSQSTMALFEAYDALVAKVNEAWAEGDASKKTQEAFGAFLEEAYDSAHVVQVQVRVTEAYAGYLRTLSADSDGRGSQPATDAYLQYQQALSEVPADLQERAASAWKRYSETLEAVPSKISRVVNAAYKAYLGEVQGAFAAIKTESLTAAELSAIAQSLLAAGNVVSTSCAAAAQLAAGARSMNPPD